jgi:hypothetical protein
MKKYPPIPKTDVLEAIARIPDESLRRRARDTYLKRKGWSMTSASKNGNKKRWLSLSDRVFAHKLYMSGGAGKIITDRIGERVLHCKWRNGMNFWNARVDGKRLIAAKKRAVAKARAKTSKPTAVVTEAVA